MNYLHAKIKDVSDADFQTLIDELYHCVAWRRDDSQASTLFYLLSLIYQEDPKALAITHLPGEGILTTKVDKLPPGVVHDLCRELADLSHTHIEACDGKTVLSLLKLSIPKPAPPRKVSPGQMRHEAITRVIQQRRANGDL